MESKQALREKIWRLLEDRRQARFPGARGRIPNFVGAERCTKLIAGLPVWRNAKVLKINPDSPQRAIRQRALEEGKILYMAVPRLRAPKPFFELDPARVKVSPFKASTIEGAAKYGRPVSLQEIKKIDLVVCGSVAVNDRGARIGKGGGYSDIEYALLRELGKASEDTPVLTSVHPLQIVAEDMPMTEHDIPLNFIVTPDEVKDLMPRYPKPKGIYWDRLPAEKIDDIPVLKAKRMGAH